MSIRKMSLPVTENEDCRIAIMIKPHICERNGGQKSPVNCGRMVDTYRFIILVLYLADMYSLLESWLGPTVLIALEIICPASVFSHSTKPTPMSRRPSQFSIQFKCRHRNYMRANSTAIISLKCTPFWWDSQSILCDMFYYYWCTYLFRWYFNWLNGILPPASQSTITIVNYFRFPVNSCLWNSWPPWWKWP